MIQFKVGQTVRVKDGLRDQWTELWEPSGEYEYTVEKVEGGGLYLSNKLVETLEALDGVDHIPFGWRLRKFKDERWIISWFESDEEKE